MDRDSQVTGVKRRAEADHTQSLKRKKVKFAADVKAETKTENTTPSSSSSSHKPSKDSKKRQPTALERLSARTDPSSSRTFNSSVLGPRSQKEKEDDAYIAHLEKKLGWSKGGSKTNKYGKGLEEDGLDGKLPLGCGIVMPLIYAHRRLDLLKDIDNIESSIFSSGQVSDVWLVSHTLIYGCR